ncbi:MAG: hypothetical protein RL419_569 [Actinomycetota bacterium]|jgi:hypothetical protein
MPFVTSGNSSPAVTVVFGPEGFVLNPEQIGFNQFLRV